MLAEQRPHCVVADQGSGTQTGTVDHDRCRVGGFGQRLHGMFLDLATGRGKSLSQVVQVVRHVDHRHGGAKPDPKALRQVGRLSRAQVGDQLRSGRHRLGRG